MKACIVLPTYNEKENIEKLLNQILKITKNLKHKLTVLVVDDNSPDRTGEIVEKLSKKNNRIMLLRGKKEGLGKAYLRGFKYVLDKFDFDAVFMMDADFSHDPKEIIVFLEEMEKGYDFIIGSRYVPGGNIPDWNMQRRIISRFGNLFLRFMGGLYAINDCTSGYRLIRTDLLKKIKFTNLHTRGYAFLSTLLYECVEKGAKVKEIPITFKDRRFGETKLKKSDIIEFFFNAMRIRLKSSKRFIKFTVVGATGVFVNLGALYIFVERFGLDKSIIAPSIALELSILWNFLLNNAWTFKRSRNKSPLLVKLFKFNLIALIGFAINLAIYNFLLNFSFLSAFFGRFDYLAAQFIAILIVTVWNYFVNKNWTWR